MNNRYLLTAGIASMTAGLLHIGVIIGGPDWYRFFGAGEEMARMAERGEIAPAIITSIIAFILFAWGCYAFSALKMIPRLPLIKLCLVLITSVYLIRGTAGFILPLMLPDHPTILENSITFWFWSSAICLSIGLLHLIGVRKAWATL